MYIFTVCACCGQLIYDYFSYVVVFGSNFSHSIIFSLVNQRLNWTNQPRPTKKAIKNGIDQSVLHFLSSIKDWIGQTDQNTTSLFEQNKILIVDVNYHPQNWYSTIFSINIFFLFLINHHRRFWLVWKYNPVQRLGHLTDRWCYEMSDWRIVDMTTLANTKYKIQNIE